MILRFLLATPFFLYSISVIDLLRFELPPKETLNESIGVLRTDPPSSYKRGRALRIETPYGHIEPTCRILVNDTLNCFSKKELGNLANREVRILWSDQPIFIFKSEPRIFELSADNGTIYGYERMVLLYQGKKRDFLSIGLAFLSLIFGLVTISKGLIK